MKLPQNPSVSPYRAQLTAVIREFAGTLLTDIPLQDILDRLVERVVDILPIDAAAITVFGACSRRPRALHPDVGAVSTFPLRRGDRQIGALDLYRAAPGYQSEAVRTAAQSLADIAAAYFSTSRACGKLQFASEASFHACAAFVAPFLLSSGELTLTASIGISLSDHDGRTPQELLHDADAAMYGARRGGGAKHRVFPPKASQQPTAQTGLEIDLAAALARGQLYPVYQPIVATVDGRITGFEALLRWEHPTLGMIPPEVFIPLAEQSGQIIDLGQWILGRACSDLRRWRKLLPAMDLKMAVNLSARQLLAPELPATVATLMLSTDAQPDSIILEVTESILITDSQRASVVLNGLKRLGVQLALDDFGTGCSSLIHLSQFPVDVVKIDRAFVRNIGRDSTSQIILGAVVQLAHDLGMTVIAEGIETEQQRAETTSLGCDFAQGFHFAPPLPAADIDAIIFDHLGGIGDLHLPPVRGYPTVTGNSKTATTP